MALHLIAKVVFSFFEPNGREKHPERAAALLLK